MVDSKSDLADSEMITRFCYEVLRNEHMPVLQCESCFHDSSGWCNGRKATMIMSTFYERLFL